MSTSDTYNFNPSLADIVLESYDRIGMRPTMLTRQHMISATRSINLALQTWGNRGVNLWAVDLQTVPMTQGVPTYNLPSDTVSILDAYRSTYQNTNTISIPTAFSTTTGSTGVIVNQANHGLSFGYLVQVIIPVSVGGIIIFGSYFVTSVIDNNNFTITASKSATSTISMGGSVPAFTSTNGSQTFLVTLNNHGSSSGASFYVQASTIVGGQALLGPFMVQSVIDANNFTILGPAGAISSQTVFENDGMSMVTEQSSSVEPIDQFMQPISRTEYSTYADKFSQSPPTVYWFDRLSPIPTVTLWEVPDANGPYLFKYYRMRRVQDASATMGQTADVPYLFIDALCADVANRLARKYAPSLAMQLAVEAKAAWDEAATENREYVDIRVLPQLDCYWTL